MWRVVVDRVRAASKELRYYREVRYEDLLADPIEGTLDVLAWARDLSKRGWQIMVLRARDYSLPLIADMLRSAITDIRNDHADAIHVVASAASRTPNMWWTPLDNPPQMGDVARRHHCAQSAVVFSFEQ